jgi:hypothetical protein
MPAPKTPNTVNATAATIRKGDETAAARLRAHGWRVSPPMPVAENPDDWSFAAHAAGGYKCGYAPLLTNGRLVRAHDPAWQMAEKTRDPGCLNELVRIRAVKAATDRRPGYNLGYCHSHRSQREYPGYPDCHIWGEGSLHRELKRMGRSPEPAQAATLTRMGHSLDVGVWWPCCWYSGRVDRELGALAGRHEQDLLIGQHWAPGLPPQPGQPGYTPWTPDTATPPGQAATTNTTPAGPLYHPDSRLPGRPLPAQFTDDMGPGYVIPMPRDDRAITAGAHLDRWLRQHGISPTYVPYPVEIIDGPAGVAVRCVGLGPTASYTWRWAPKVTPLTSQLLAALDVSTLWGEDVTAMLDRPI